MEAEVGTLSFKDVEGLDFESAYAKLKAVIADQCKKLEKLHDDGSVNYGDADIFKRLILKPQVMRRFRTR